MKWQETKFDPTKNEFQIGINQKYFQPPGRLWIASIKNISNKQMNEITKNINYNRFHNDLKKSGWNWQQTINNNQIIFAEADGVTASIWGYLKIQNERLRIIGMAFEITDFTDASSKNEPLVIKCPCTLNLKVFVSDEVAIKKLIKENEQ